MKKYLQYPIVIAGLLFSTCGILAPIDHGYHAIIIRKNGKLNFKILNNRNQIGTTYSMRAYEKKTGKLVWYTGKFETYKSRLLQTIPYGYQDPIYCKESSPRTVNPENRCIALPLQKGKVYIMQARVPGHPGIPQEKLCPPLEFTP